MLTAAPPMVVARDEPGELILNAPWPHPRHPRQPMSFGMVRSGRAYVSYHLMPLYGARAAGLPGELKARMQGKTCFNFRTRDPALFAELASVTRRCAEAFETPIAF